jgi:trimethylamine--corrinoid protein Co-methyltransferase
MIQGLIETLVPPVVNDSTLAFEAIKAVKPGGHFLGTDHTLERYKDAFYSPILSDWQNFENWQDQGSKTATERANAVWKTLLAEYSPPEIAEGIEEKLDVYIERRKSEINGG